MVPGELLFIECDDADAVAWALEWIYTNEIPRAMPLTSYIRLYHCSRSLDLPELGDHAIENFRQRMVMYADFLRVRISSPEIPGDILSPDDVNDIIPAIRMVYEIRDDPRLRTVCMDFVRDVHFWVIESPGFVPQARQIPAFWQFISEGVVTAVIQRGYGFPRLCVRCMTYPVGADYRWHFIYVNSNGATGICTRCQARPFGQIVYLGIENRWLMGL
ncbi:hypothetical protein F5Y18DRAFT_278205 [Xylariaceae sp. FL1019]|nr:hypothetical protein F5Y18DRAFT_278205 [Xylariaceae sp. FL1019]